MYSRPYGSFPLSLCWEVKHYLEECNHLPTPWNRKYGNTPFLFEVNKNVQGIETQVCASGQSRAKIVNKFPLTFTPAVRHFPTQITTFNKAKSTVWEGLLNVL